MGVLPDVLGAAPRPALEGVGESGLQRFRLAYRALPGRDLHEVSLRTRLLGAELSAPVVLVGDDRPLARVATEHGLGLVANRLSPDRPPLWLASLDVTALRVAGGPERAEQLVSSLDADGLVLRLNGLDEALREDGQPLMRHATEAIASVAERLRPLPVVVCGTGFGMDAADVASCARPACPRSTSAGGAAAAGGCRPPTRWQRACWRRTGCRCSPAFTTASSREVPRPRCRRRLGRVAAAGGHRRVRRAAPRGGVGDGRACRGAAHAGASARRVALGAGERQLSWVGKWVSVGRVRGCITPHFRAGAGRG